MDDQELVELLAQTWQSIDDLGAGLTEVEWKIPTDLPGWSVQDNLAHLIGIEATLLGQPASDHVAPDAPHIKNDIGKMNERWVDERRSRGGAEVLAEFRAVAEKRLALLRSFSADDFAQDSWTPVGPGTVRDMIPFRIFDSWAHEQDMRRAVGKPGDLDTPSAANSFDRVAGAMPYVIGKKLKPPDGTTIVFEVTGAVGHVVALGVEGGRARALDVVPDNPATKLIMDFETFACLGLGRWNATNVMTEGRVAIEGDTELARRTLEAMNFLF